MDFRTFVESWLHLDDPTGYGLQIKARLERVPGPKGKGAYLGTLHIGTPMRVGGGVYHTRSQPSIEAAQTALRELLQSPTEAWIPQSMVKSGGSHELTKVEIKGLPAAKVHALKPVLIYGGNWDIKALQRQPGYSREKHVADQQWMDKFMGVMDKFQREIAKEPRKEFGLYPPEYGQWLTPEDTRRHRQTSQNDRDIWRLLACYQMGVATEAGDSSV